MIFQNTKLFVLIVHVVFSPCITVDTERILHALKSAHQYKYNGFFLDRSNIRGGRSNAGICYKSFLLNGY